jgi:hypothetical protein
MPVVNVRVVRVRVGERVGPVRVGVRQRSVRVRVLVPLGQV